MGPRGVLALAACLRHVVFARSANDGGLPRQMTSNDPSHGPLNRCSKYRDGYDG